MTENRLNPFENDTDKYVCHVDSDAVEREVASKQKEQNVRKNNTDVSDHAHSYRL